MSIMRKKIVGLVLARAGSKGLPGKNFRELLGRPLIQYAVEAGLQSEYVDDVVLSSDCERCMEIARCCGAEVRFKRPEYLARDTTSSAEVILHAIDFLEKRGRSYDILVLIEPTSPLRDAADIDLAIEALLSSDKTSLVSVCKAEDQHPNFMFSMAADGALTPWSGVEFLPLRRQEVSPAFFLEGSVYISQVDKFRDTKTFCHDQTLGFEVPKWKSIEVDDIWDFVCAEAILKYRQKNEE